jgi:hypothetical protein
MFIQRDGEEGTASRWARRLGTATWSEWHGAPSHLSTSLPVTLSHTFRPPALTPPARQVVYPLSGLYAATRALLNVYGTLAKQVCMTRACAHRATRVWTRGDRPCTPLRASLLWPSGHRYSGTPRAHTPVCMRFFDTPRVCAAPRVQGTTRDDMAGLAHFSEFNALIGLVRLGSSCCAKETHFLAVASLGAKLSVSIALALS